MAAKISPETAETIRQLYIKGVPSKLIAERVGVHKKTVNEYVLREEKEDYWEDCFREVGLGEGK